MKVTIYYIDGRRSEIDLVHEILERADDVAITYTQLFDNTYQTRLVKNYELATLGVKL